jgi:glycosyltransferase involved in cell wall biosynthesis
VTTAVVLAHRLPYPPQGGADLRNWANVRALARAARVGVFALERPVPPPECDGVVEWQVTSDRSLAEPRPATAANALTWLRNPAAHPSDRWFSPVAAAELVSMVERLEPDVVVVEQLWLHRYVAELRRFGCPVVYDAHNLEGPVHSEVAGTRNDRLSAMFAERTYAIEGALLESVDQIWACSGDDVARGRELYPSAAPMAVVPNTIDVGAYECGDGAGTTLLYPGVFSYPPNRLAAARLVDEIFPALAKVRADARLQLVGGGPTDDMLAAAARDTRIEVTGQVADTLPYMRAAAVLPIPLQEGGGTRFKALEAFASGLPVVSTAKGVEGLEVAAGEHYLEAETTAEFVEAIAALLEDEGLRRHVADRALAVVRERYSHAVTERCIHEALSSVMELTGAGGPR